VPVYLHCPHCEHPQVVSPARRGKTLFCKQCGRAYRTSRTNSDVHPLNVASYGELHRRMNPAGAVYVLDA